MLNSKRKFKLKTNIHAHSDPHTHGLYGYRYGTCVCSRKANFWAGNARTKMANRRALRPRKKKKKYHIQKKFCLLFESFQVKLASECMCVCAINTYTRVQPTHPVHTHTKEASIHAKNKHHTHTPQTTAHQLHTHRQSSKFVCMPYTGENKRDIAISPY